MSSPNAKRERVYDGSTDLVEGYDRYFFGGLIGKYGFYSDFDFESNNIQEYEWELLKYVFEIYVPILQTKYPALKNDVYRRKVTICMFGKIFGWNLENVLQLYKNKNSSCYLDSVAIALLFAKGNFQKAVFDSPITTKYGHEVRKILTNDYLSFANNNPKTCGDLRSIIRKVAPHPIGQYPAFSVYDAFCDIFPSLKMKDVPYIHYTKSLKNAAIRPLVYPTENVCLVTVWDFMDGDVLQDREGRVFMWELYQGNHIVFHNTLTPPITHLDNTEEESVDYGGEELVHRKIRCFGETILNGNFELTAVVLHKGPKPTPETEVGGHYVLYFKSHFDDGWYYYDDLEGGGIQKTKLPLTIFTSGNRTRPELLFYARVKNKRVRFPDYELLVDVFQGKTGKVILDYARRNKVRVELEGRESLLMSREEAKSLLDNLKRA